MWTYQHRKLAWLVLAIAVLAFPFTDQRALAQWIENPATGSAPSRVTDRTTLAGQSGTAPLLAAELVDRDRNARQHKAVVDVQTEGVEIVDPAEANYIPKLDQAHIQYQLDGGAIYNSTATSETFQDLTSGKHHINVVLAANDNRPVKSVTLKVYIP